MLNKMLKIIETNKSKIKYREEIGNNAQSEDST